MNLHHLKKSLRMNILMLKPWISKEILQKCKERDSLLKCISYEDDPVLICNLRNAYKKLRNEITKDKRDSKKSYYSSYFEENKQKSSEIWKGIRSLVNIKSSKSSTIKLLDENSNLVSDPNKISCVFNNYFSTIGHITFNKEFHVCLAVSMII